MLQRTRYSCKRFKERPRRFILKLCFTGGMAYNFVSHQLTKHETSANILRTALKAFGYSMNFNKVLASFTKCKYHIRENKRKLKLKLSLQRITNE